MSDPFQHFLDAQAPVMAQVRQELLAGKKHSHWMWFVFPQIAGLGRSVMAQRFALASLAEAKAYAAHPVLGPRLRECTELVLSAKGRSAPDIFGTPDDLKFRSCMTLFLRASGHRLFRQALERYFDRAEDQETLKRIR